MIFLHGFYASKNKGKMPNEIELNKKDMNDQRKTIRQIKKKQKK